MHQAKGQIATMPSEQDTQLDPYRNKTAVTTRAPMVMGSGVITDVPIDPPGFCQLADLDWNIRQAAFKIVFVQLIVETFHLRVGDPVAHGVSMILQLARGVTWKVARPGPLKISDPMPL